MTIKAKIAGGIVTGAILAASLAPVGAFAANNVTVSGNGADSTNKVKIKDVNKNRVVQTNATAVVNHVGVFQNTGGNKANKNTGGNVTVKSGDATSHVTNTTTTGGNVVVSSSCGCQSVENTVDVKNNGADSTNKVKVKSISNDTVVQSNYTLVVNGVLVAQNTGDNHANKNTGGAVMVDSGDADSTVTNTTTTGYNVITTNP